MGSAVSVLLSARAGGGDDAAGVAVGCVSCGSLKANVGHMEAVAAGG